MITDFTTPFVESKSQFVKAALPSSPDYIDLLRLALQLINSWGKTTTSEGWSDMPDPGRIHQIDDGDYQGTYVFVVAAQGYQPSTYWATKVSYGSCSGCDTIQAIWDGEGEEDYYTLALHMVQGLQKIA
jgi:hypothetical protein